MIRDLKNDRTFRTFCAIFLLIPVLIALAGVPVSAQVRVECIDTPLLVMPIMSVSPNGSTGDVRIFNASEVKTVEFSLCCLREINPVPGPEVILSVTQEGNVFVYRVEATGGQFGVEEVELRFTSYCDSMQEPSYLCDNGGFESIHVESVEAWDGNGNPVGIGSRDGAEYFLATDVEQGEPLLVGMVYYSDGTTAFPGAVVNLYSVDNVPFGVQGNAGGGGGYQIGDYVGLRTSSPGSDVGYYTLRAFAAAPNCGPTTGLMDIPLSKEFGTTAETDFIIPVAPPAPDTPTPTETPTPQFTPTPVSADLNNDGTVDSDDLIILMNEWRKEKNSQP